MSTEQFAAPILTRERLVIHGSTAGALPRDSFRVSDARWAKGTTEYLGVVVVARRHVSLANIKLSLLGYEYEKPDPGPGPIDHPRTPRLLRSKTGPHILIVEFPPQHIAEQIETSPVGENEERPPAISRLSGPTRLVFEIPKEAGWDPIYLDLDALTDWSKLTPLIHPRAAASIGSSLLAQRIAVFGSTAGTKHTFEEATREIAKSLVGPSGLETSLELSGRLLFSPSEDGKWLRSEAEAPKWNEASGGLHLSVPIWTARLNDRGRKSVRAVWSTQLPEGLFPSVGDDYPGTCAKPMLSLTPNDHWEIVGQTSVFGLPALRRLPPATGSSPHGLANAPDGSVIRPDESVHFLEQIDCAMGYSNEDSGIAVATPFRDANVSLSALGGIVTLEWKGEPARLLPSDLGTFPSPEQCGAGCPTKRPWSGFSLERLFLGTWLGRDSRVVAVRKGFLYPLGIRASYVRVHERQIHLDSKRGPVSFLVQREFIVVPARRRTYPGPYHPYDAREFPALGVRMKTLVTPDVKTTAAIGLNLASEKEVFWPQILEKDGKFGDFQFEWATDDVELVRSPLVFLTNDKASAPKVLAALERSYLANDARRTAHFGGARQRYAEPLRPGDTSFDTDSWLLGVTGRTDGEDTDDERFRMDGRMEGADQPPFYPRVESATVGLQTVDRLLGSPQGRYGIVFDKDYLRQGFEGKSDIYVRLTGSGVSMNAANQTPSTGGLSSQQLTVGGLSRKVGPVGGTAPKPFASRTSAAVAREVSVDISDAKDGHFNPKQFFGDVRLLGILNLADVLSENLDFETNAPQLCETLTFGAEQQGLVAVKEAAQSALELLYGSSQLKANLEAWLAGTIPGTKISVREAYPALAEALLQLIAGLKVPLEAVSKIGDTSGLAVLATQILGLSKPVIHEAERILADPVPQMLKETFERLRGTSKALHDDAAGQVTAYANAAAEAALSWFRGAFCEAVQHHDLGTVLLGRPLVCSELDDPARALDTIEEGLLEVPLGKPLVEALADFLLWYAPHRVVAALVTKGTEALILASLRQAVEVIDKSLREHDPADLEDVRTEARQQRFVDMVRGEIDTLLVQPGTSLDETAAHLAAVLTELDEWSHEGLTAEARALREALRPIDVNQLDAIAASLTDSLVTSVREAVVEPLKKGLNDLRARAKVLQDAIAGAPIDLLIALTRQTFELLSYVQLFAAVAQKGAQWCEALNRAANALSVKLTGPIADATDQLSALIDAAKLIQRVGTPDSEIARACAIVLAEGKRLKAELQTVHPAMNPDLCSDPEATARLVQSYLQLRRISARALFRIAHAASSLDAWLISAPEKEALNRILSNCAQLYLGTTAIERLVNDEANWREVCVAVDAVAAEIEILIPGYEAKLRQALAAAKSQAASLYPVLANLTITPAELLNAAGRVDQLLDDLDHKLAGLLLQSAVFGEELVGIFKAEAQKALKSFAQSTSHPLLQVYLALAAAFSALADLGDELLFYAIGQTGTGFRNLAQTLKDESEEISSLETLSEADAFPKLRALIQRFAAGNDALHKTVVQIKQLTMSNFGQAVTEKIHAELEQLLDLLRNMARQFVPTSIRTTYSWQTEVPPFPNKEDPLFWMVNGSTQSDLMLISDFEADLITQQVSATIKGTLQPFALKVATSKFDMATITFTQAHFASANGGMPKFDIGVDKVDIGKYLEFIRALQGWLSPQGSGLYVTPFLGKSSGIEVGYLYDAGIIQVGSLQFINVAFRVAAKLFYSGEAAEFMFALGSERYPVLVANPPYGGGGFIELVCDPKGVTAMDVSIVFGGVAALKFGPLNAQGRVVAGIQVISQMVGDRKAMTFVALFEAVGEGSIACFSLSISIRVTLTQHAGGTLYGRTDYSFKFKAGCFTVRYKVSASYKLAGGASRATELKIPHESGRDAIVHRSRVPRKSTEWKAYSSLFALDLVRRK